MTRRGFSFVLIGAGDFAKNSGEIATLLEGAEDGRDILGEFVEAKAAVIEAVSAGRNDASVWGADRDVDVGIVEAHSCGSQLA